MNEQPEKFKEIAPFVWRNVDGGSRVAAKSRMAMSCVSATTNIHS